MKVYKNKVLIKKISLGAMCLALAWLLPFVAGTIPEIGGMLCPMHIPALLLGVFLGPVCGAAAAFIAPITRGLIFGTPIIFPRGVAMAFELAAYALVFGILRRILPKKIGYTYLALVIAMLAGRVVGGAVKLVLYTSGAIGSFGWKIFMTSYFVETIPGVIIQLIIIPALILALDKNRLLED